MTRPGREPLVLLVLAGVAIVVAGVRPFDRFTWFLEVAPILIAAPILVATARRFPLSDLLYRLLFLHALVLTLGSHYSYARVPLGEWAREAFGFARNHYDRVGHFAQGFIPAILVRELLLRTSPLRRGRWLSFLVVCVCLAVSAVYEFIEWWVAVGTGEAADAFLGSQGDVWDTQWDMFLCTLGATVSLVVLGRLHDRALTRRLGDTPAPTPKT